MSVRARKQWIEKAGPVAVARQCRLLSLSRSTAYYAARPPDAEDLALMRRLDEAHMAYPWYGSRSLRTWLWREHGLRVNRKRVRRLMRTMGLHSIAPQRKTTQPNPAHPVYPYLLRNVTVERRNQVWAADITYIPMARGFVYLMAIIDWYSRKVLAWRLSNTMDVEFCLAALREALVRYGTPEIFNTDQGAQFTSSAFVQTLHDANVRVSMDGKRRWIDNVFVERLWRSLKYEEVYLHAYATVTEAQRGIGRYLGYYNGERFHQGLDNRTPDEVYDGQDRDEDARVALAA